jgi:hypothetical protein
MSKLRPGLNDSKEQALPDETAYYAVYGAVQAQDGLCHGKLHDGRGAHCAIGSLWTTSHSTLKSAFIDEVAAVNDSVPHLSNKQRKAHVLRWLRWKLDRLGVKGIRGARC